MAAPVARARYCRPMKPEHRTGPWPRSVVFALVSLLAGALSGGLIMMVAAGAAGSFPLGFMGMLAGAVLAVFGVVGALVGGWLVSARTESLAWRGLGVALGTAIVVGAAVSGFGVAAPGALTITAIIVVGLTLSAVAPWRGGFARRIEGPAAPTADPGVGA